MNHDAFENAYSTKIYFTFIVLVCGCETHKNNPANVYCGTDKHSEQNPECYYVICPHCFKDFILPQPEPVTSYAEKSATQTSNVETVPYPIFSGHRYSSETESRNIHIDYDEERWGNNWWFGYSFHFRDYYRKTNLTRTYNTHRDYHWEH